MHARLFQKLLEIRDYQVNYRELQDKAHWWDEPRSEGGGSDAVDNYEIIEFLRKQKREIPNSFKIRLYDLSLNDRFYWIRVLSQEKSMSQTRIDASVKDGQVILETENVRSLEIDLESLKHDVDQIHWNGVKTPVLGNQKVVLGEHLESPLAHACLLYTSPSPRDSGQSRMPSSA